MFISLLIIVVGIFGNSDCNKLVLFGATSPVIYREHLLKGRLSIVDLLIKVKLIMIAISKACDLN